MEGFLWLWGSCLPDSGSPAVVNCLSEEDIDWPQTKTENAPLMLTSPLKEGAFLIKSPISFATAVGVQSPVDWLPLEVAEQWIVLGILESVGGIVSWPSV